LRTTANTDISVIPDAMSHVNAASQIRDPTLPPRIPRLRGIASRCGAHGMTGLRIRL
jgi:hypothetical protein